MGDAIRTFLAECTPEVRASFEPELAGDHEVPIDALCEAVWTRVLPELLARRLPAARAAWKPGAPKTRVRLARAMLSIVDGSAGVRPEDRAARLLELIEREPEPMAYVLSFLIAALDRAAHPVTRANNLGAAMARAYRVDPDSAGAIVACLKGP
jgi:hypothetical protein